MREDWKTILKSLSSFTYRSERLDYSETNSWTKSWWITLFGSVGNCHFSKLSEKQQCKSDRWHIKPQIISAVSSRRTMNLCGSKRDSPLIPLCFECHWRCQLCSDYGIFLLVLMMKEWKLKQTLSPMFQLEFAVLTVRNIIFWSP